MDKEDSVIENYFTALPFLVRLPLPSDLGVVAKETARLLSLGKFRLFARCRSVKHLVESCLGAYSLSAEVKFHFFDKRKAYMSDKGFLSFSQKFLCLKESERITKIVFHEIGHIVLSEQAFYGELLKREDGALENLASAISIEIIRQILAIMPNESLGKIVADEQEKLTVAIKKEKGEV